MSVAIRSISLIHVIIPVFCKHHRRVMHIAQVPAATVRPVSDAGIVILISGSYIVRKLFVDGLAFGGSFQRIRVGVTAVAIYECANILSGIAHQA